MGNGPALHFALRKASRNLRRPPDLAAVLRWILPLRQQVSGAAQSGRPSGVAGYGSHGRRSLSVDQRGKAGQFFIAYKSDLEQVLPSKLLTHRDGKKLQLENRRNSRRS